MSPKKKRTIKAQDLYNFQLISDVRLSPDGEQVIYNLQRVDQETEKKYSNLWIVPSGGGEARAFTTGDQNDTQPRWSPDGSQIAYSTWPEEDFDIQFEIYVMNADGSNPTRLTTDPSDESFPTWSPQ